MQSNFGEKLFFQSFIRINNLLILLKIKCVTFDSGVRFLDIDDLGWSTWSNISQRCAR